MNGVIDHEKMDIVRDCGGDVRGACLPCFCNK